MPRLLYTVDNLVDEVRSQLDEQNVDSVDTDRDILPSLNRGQDFAFDILARRYPEPLLKYESLALSDGVSEYDIPERVFEDRVLKIEVEVPSGSGATYREVERISYRDISDYESASKTNVPSYYSIVGRKIRLVPQPTGTYDARLWYLRNPEKLVQPQGRITIINSGSNYVLLDGIGSALTTESDQLGSYVNFVDGQTGEIKGTAQIQNINNERVTFRSVPTRSSVLNRTIGGAISTMSLSQDDYICAVDGTCVPYFGRPVSNFLIQFSVAELTRKLGGSADIEERVLDKFEKQVERTSVGRESQFRISKKSRIWGTPTRRLYWE